MHISSFIGDGSKPDKRNNLNNNRFGITAPVYETWTDKHGATILIKDMDDSYLINAMNWLIKRIAVGSYTTKNMITLLERDKIFNALVIEARYRKLDLSKICIDLNLLSI